MKDSTVQESRGEGARINLINHKFNQTANTHSILTSNPSTTNNHHRIYYPSTPSQQHPLPSQSPPS